MNIGCILWCLLCLLIIALVACITPWWFIPVNDVRSKRDITVKG